ncbi:MAG: ATP-binding protein [Acidobacteriota bacterium]|nr:ATP-binding protein [Acidobacteriota bacterium]
MSQTSEAKTNAAAVDQTLLARLRSVPILESLPTSELECLLGGRLVHLAPGEYVARQGETARFFWILLEGELRVFSGGPDGSETTWATVASGTALGELPLLANVPNAANVQTVSRSQLLQLDEQQFWNLMTACPDVRKAILGNMAYRFQKTQSAMVQQEKMAALGTLAAGLMHELNNPGTAAVRAASQLRENLLRMHRLTAKFSKVHMSDEQKACMFELQEYALGKAKPVQMNSLEQSDAEESLAQWMEGAGVEDAWRLAPTLVSIGIDSNELTCARSEFPGPFFSDALNWLEALVSSMHLVSTIEESIGRISGLVKAVKTYAYEGKGQKQTVDVNESIHATLVILAHKMREKQITVEKEFAAGLPGLVSECTGLNQVWTNLLDNAIDAVKQNGRIRIRTWAEETPVEPGTGAAPRQFLCVAIEDDGGGIPLESQPHIFDPFYTTKPVGVGTGLGLGIVQRIIDQYRGSIAFSSEPGRTEFRVRLPRERS